jgi:hypothetical protein
VHSWRILAPVLVVVSYLATCPSVAHAAPNVAVAQAAIVLFPDGDQNGTYRGTLLTSAVLTADASGTPVSESDVDIASTGPINVQETHTVVANPPAVDQRLVDLKCTGSGSFTLAVTWRAVGQSATDATSATATAQGFCRPPLRGFKERPDLKTFRQAALDLSQQAVGLYLATATNPAPAAHVAAALIATGATYALLAGVLWWIGTAAADPNYKVLVTPRPASVPAIGSASVSDVVAVASLKGVVDALAPVISAGQALAKTVAKISGAEDAGDTAWRDKQVANAHHLAALLSDKLSVLRDLQSALPQHLGDGGVTDFQIPDTLNTSLKENVLGGELPAPLATAVNAVNGASPIDRTAQPPGMTVDDLLSYAVLSLQTVPVTHLYGGFLGNWTQATISAVSSFNPPTPPPPPPTPATSCGAAPVQKDMQNGSFEEPKLTSAFQAVGPPGKGVRWLAVCQLGAWTVAGPLDLVSASQTNTQPTDGDQFLDMDQHFGPNKTMPFSDIYQDVSTIPLVFYEIDLLVAANVNGDPEKKTAVLSAGGTQTTLTASIGKHTLEKMGWAPAKMTFLAKSTVTRIEIRSTTPSDNGLLIDGVRMRVSNPLPLILLIGGVVAVIAVAAFIWWRRRRSRLPAPVTTVTA